MTTTIPTAELVGTINDAIPFASDDKALPVLNAVQIEWDGEVLHARATDRYRAGWSRWDSNNEPGDLDHWGEGEPFKALISVDDAKQIVSLFKLPAKQGQTPVTVSVGYDAVTIVRDVPGYPDLTAVFHTVTTTFSTFPDLTKFLTDREPELDPTGRVTFEAKKLASFAKVRAHGPLQLRFAGEHGTTIVRIGDRFDGAIRPVRLVEDAATTPAVDDDDDNEDAA